MKKAPASSRNAPRGGVAAPRYHQNPYLPPSPTHQHQHLTTITRHHHTNSTSTNHLYNNPGVSSEIMKFYIESYGCTMNQGEGRAMADALMKLGFEETNDPDEAGLLILNSCIVIKATERKMVQRLERLKRTGAPVIVTGCMADVLLDKITKSHGKAIIIRTGKKNQLKELIGTAQTIRTGSGEGEQSEKTSQRASPTPKSPSFILPISEGCLGHCSYCITRFARGRLNSYEPGELVSCFGEAVQNGAKEIFLTSQDTAIYGQDLGFSLPELLHRLLAVEGRYFIRIGMMNPDSLQKIFQPFFEAFRDRSVYKFLHVPVQSGSDGILERMDRNYTVDQYIKLITQAREKETLTLSTDIIVGFPGETEEDFQKSVALIKTIKPDVVNITRFSERPGTEAAGFQGKVHGRITKERSRVLTKVVDDFKLKNNEGYIGKTCEILITKHGHHGAALGRNRFYKPVALFEELKIGEFYEVEIEEAYGNYLVGTRVL